MTFNLNSRLPDYRLDPPDEDDRPFEMLTRIEQIERLGQEFTWQELAEMYLDALEGKK